MKATITFVEKDYSTKADITIQENLTFDIVMPLTKEAFDICATLGLFISIQGNVDDILMIDTQVCPSAIKEIEFE